MEALGGNGAFCGWKLPDIRRPKKPSPSKSKSSDSSVEPTGGGGHRFPLKQAVTAASLAITGDTIAQLNDRWRKRKQSVSDSSDTSEGGPSSSPCGFHVHRVHFLELLLIINLEQVDSTLPHR
ncbi:hypothetical protein V6N13_127428 [Hibiscus sabdariffa]|uniref:Uncharacterized protein n=1 Tax=Hibiscus sabdariffa TaxID=183260 RepID=A0ABR2RCT4_9ROSI